MGKKNLKKIFLGLLLIIFAFFLVTACFYLLEVRPEIEARKQAQMKEISVQKAKIEQRAKEIQKAKKQEGTIRLESLVKRAEAVYDKSEKSRQEGFLWIDRESSRFVVTLGAVHGIMPGNYLTVYEEGKKIAQVAVDTCFDVISYVHPIEKSSDFFNKDYYLVIRE